MGLPTPPPPRPTSITVIMVLMYLMALVSIVVAVAGAIDRGNPDVAAQTGLTSSQTAGLAVIEIGLAVITALLAYLLGRGSSVARWVIAVIALVWVAAGVGGIGAFTGAARWHAFWQIAVGLAALYFLVGQRQETDAYFEAMRSPG